MLLDSGFGGETLATIRTAEALIGDPGGLNARRAAIELLLAKKTDTHKDAAALLAAEPPVRRAIVQLVEDIGISKATNMFGPTLGLALSYLHARRYSAEEVRNEHLAFDLFCKKYGLNRHSYEFSRGWEINEERHSFETLAKREVALYCLLEKGSTSLVVSRDDLASMAQNHRSGKVAQTIFQADIEKIGMKVIFRPEHPIETELLNAGRENKSDWTLGSVGLMKEMLSRKGMIRAHALMDGPIGLAVCYEGAPVHVTSFFPESEHSCSIIQNQRAYFTAGGASDARSVDIHNRDIPLLRSINLRTMMIELSRRVLSDYGFEEVRVPSSTEKNLARFRERHIAPEKVVHFYDAAAEACDLRRIRPYFWTNSTRHFNISLWRAAGKIIPVE